MVLRKAWQFVFGKPDQGPQTEEAAFLNGITHGQTHLFGLNDKEGVIVTRGNGDRFAFDLAHVASFDGIPAHNVCAHALGVDLIPAQDGRVVLEFEHAEKLLARLPALMPREEDAAAPRRRPARLALVR